MGQSHECSLHPNYWYLGFCDSGWDRYGNFFIFHLILISTLKHIRYLMIFISDVSNKSTVISSFGDIVEKCFVGSSVTCNITCTTLSCRMCTWIYSCGFNGQTNPLDIFEVVIYNYEYLPMKC